MIQQLLILFFSVLKLFFTILKIFILKPLLRFLIILAPFFKVLTFVRNFLIFKLFTFYFLFIISCFSSIYIKINFLEHSGGNLELYLVLIFLFFSFQNLYYYINKLEINLFISILSNYTLITFYLKLASPPTFNNKLFSFFICNNQTPQNSMGEIWLMGWEIWLIIFIVFLFFLFCCYATFWFLKRM